MIDDDGKSSICKESLEQVQLRFPGAEIWDFDKAIELKVAHDRAKYSSPPTEISEERWIEMLEVLPPMKWRGKYGSESFMISEALTFDIRSIFCRIGNRYFELCDTDTLTHDQIVEKCTPLLTAIAD
jgi:hypothetical protein